MRLLLEQDRLVAALEDVPHAPVARVERLRIRTVEPAHAEGKIRPRRLEHEVVVIPHQTVGMANPGAARANPREQLEETATIALVEKDRPARVPAARYVVNRTRILMPKLPRHTPEPTTQQQRSRAPRDPLHQLEPHPPRLRATSRRNARSDPLAA